MRTLTIILTWLLLALGAGGQSITTSTPNYDRTFYARKFGAVPGDANEDKAGITNAIAAAVAAGGGVVQLEAGNYRVSPLATGLGILVPNNVTLRGVGPATVITGYTATSSAAFCVIANDNYNDAATDYGADALRVEDLTVSVDATTGGNAINCHSLIGVGHAPTSFISRVRFTGCYYHAVEWNRCGSPTGWNVLQDCTFTGSYNQSMPVEIDGSGALAGVSTTPRTKTTRNILIDRCVCEARPVGDSPGSGTAILLTHNAVDRLENCIIRNCHFEGFQPTGFVNTVAFITADTVLENIRGLTIEGCTFKGASRTTNRPVYLVTASAAQVLDGVTIRNNRFTGEYRVGLEIGHSGADTVATLHDTRNGIRIENNIFTPTMAVTPYDSGIATAGASGTLTDTNKAWSTNFYANSTVSIISGTGVGQTKTITSNTATVLTISGTFSPVPDTTSYYRIDRQYGAAVTTGSVTSATATTTTDSTRQWVADELIGRYITYTSGALSGTTRQITANTATAITHGSGTAASAADTYRIDTTPVQKCIRVAGCNDVTITGNRFTYPYDYTGVSSGSGGLITLSTATCRNVFAAGNHFQYLHTVSQLGAPAAGTFIPWQVDLTKLQTNSLTSVFRAVNNTLSCTTAGVWLFLYEPTNSDSRTAAWTYLTGEVSANVVVTGTTSSGYTNYFQRNDLQTASWSQTQSLPTIASASTIAPTTRVFFVSGSTTINTITAQTLSGSLGNEIVIIPASGATWATGTSGNIAIASTAVVSKSLHMTWDPQTAKWYPSY